MEFKRVVVVETADGKLTFQCWQVVDSEGNVLLQYVYTTSDRTANWALPVDYLVQFGDSWDYFEYQEFTV